MRWSKKCSRSRGKEDSFRKPSQSLFIVTKEENTHRHTHIGRYIYICLCLSIYVQIGNGRILSLSGPTGRLRWPPNKRVHLHNVINDKVLARTNGITHTRWICGDASLRIAVARIPTVERNRLICSLLTQVYSWTWIPLQGFLQWKRQLLRSSETKQATIGNVTQWHNSCCVC